MNGSSILDVKKYIEEHFTEDIKLDDIAKAVGYSKYYLNRMFRESTNQSIYHYIKERRLIEAANLLANTNQAIVEIALDIGYSSQQAFTLAFKQVFGCTPYCYRKEMMTFRSKLVKVNSITGFRANNCYLLSQQAQLAA